MNDEQATIAAELPDRIADTIIGMAAGDALGAGHEFARPPRPRQAAMIGGPGDWEPGDISQARTAQPASFTSYAFVVTAL